MGLIVLGGGAIGCKSATAAVRVGSATFITGSRKRGPGTIVAPSRSRCRCAPRGGLLITVWLITVT
jgi:tRNA U34 5-carboxymethylaminomethyl modifying enzyme MnmG/GidA